MFSFRVPFTMSKLALLGLREEQYFLLDDGEHRVWLKSRAAEGQPLCDATELVIRGEGYIDEEEAAEAGERWRDVVSRAFSRVHLAADFGDRRPFGSLTEPGEKWMSEELGHPVLGDRPGVTVFIDQPGLRFGSLQAEVCRRPDEDRNRHVFAEAARLSERLEGRERLAFDLFSGSYFQPSADARLLMLAMAVETLLELAPRSEAAQAHVREMIEATDRNGDLPESERQSVVGSLVWLLSESIGQAGRRVARTLEPRTYDGMRPAAFFTKVYELRSALVHGHVPRPSRDDVDRVAASLELFVGDLLAGSLLGTVPD